MSRYPPRRVSLLVRNLPLDARSDELRALFERYGEVRDVYLPRDYYTDRARGFGFVEFRDPRDAEDALYHMDRTVFGGREISVVMSKESRKTPRDMMSRERMGGDPYRYRSRSPRRRRSRDRSPRYRNDSYERGRSYRERSRSRGSMRDYSRDRRRSPSRSVSRSHGGRGRSRSPRQANGSPRTNDGGGRYYERDAERGSQSPEDEYGRKITY